MRPSVLIVGAGPAAVGAALATLRHPDVRVTVLDVGGSLEEANVHARDRLAAGRPSQWRNEDVRLTGQLPVEAVANGLPEKRSYGSDFPFRDFGQLENVSAPSDVNRTVVSGAYGGFSNAWGAQVMPFTAASFRDWPVHLHDMRPHYQAILQEIPFAAETDDLAELFPLIGRAAPLPGLSERSLAVFDHYGRNRARLKRSGVLIGKARLAMDSPACIRCGLCLTGCPYGLIYSASQTLDELRQQQRITYHGGLLALRVEEGPGGATVVAKDLRTNRLERFTADRVFLACGGIGTSQVVTSSLQLFSSPLRVAESAQFVLPFVSTYPVADPRRSGDFTLNQFNMIVSLDTTGYDVSQLHFYTYNAAFIDALPKALRRRHSRIARDQLLRRVSVALGYLPSWASPAFSLTAHPPKDDGSLPIVTLRGEDPDCGKSPMLGAVLRRVAVAAPRLDLWPALPLLRLSARGKSYHWGGTFPHAARSKSSFSSDMFGRVDPWKRIHLVDASVFPTVPATTFTLTVMANAHRIADAVQRELV